jgi:hypothetical protein
MVIDEWHDEREEWKRTNYSVEASQDVSLLRLLLLPAFVNESYIKVKKNVVSLYGRD